MTNKEKIAVCCISVIISVSLLTVVVSGATKASASTGRTPRIPVLMYHSINDEPIGFPYLSVKTDTFKDEMKYLAEKGYTPIYFDEIDHTTKIKKPILITFDDGYVDNYVNAYPILKELNIKVTSFIITDLVGTPGYLTKDQLTEMGDLVSFQSHTASHRKLTELTAQQVEDECSSSKSALETMTGKPVYVISYPNGCYNTSVVSIAKKYYEFGVTSKFGIFTLNDGKYTIKRLTVSRTDALKDFIKMLTKK